MRKGHKIVTGLAPLTALFALCSLVFAQANLTDSFTITTYYPSPYGVYRNLRLYPSVQPSTSSAQQSGTMFFNASDNSTYVYRNASLGWKPLGGASGQWVDGGNNNIYNANSGNVGIGTTTPAAKLAVTGNITASENITIGGDICNGQGICLNAAYQTNVIAGSNPSCPTGQSILMKASGGTWYTADNPAITSWNKVSCGANLNSGGQPVILLVNGYRTTQQCRDAGGQVMDAGGFKFCSFGSLANPVSSCPAPYVSFGWSATDSRTTSMAITPIWGTSTCTTGGHGFGNTMAVERCLVICSYCNGWHGAIDYSCGATGTTDPAIGCGYSGGMWYTVWNSMYKCSSSPTYAGEACAVALVYQVGCY